MDGAEDVEGAELCTGAELWTGALLCTDADDELEVGELPVDALVVGVVTGGVWSAVLVLTGRAGMRSSIAYGPFLALGGAAAILFANPPALV